VSILDALPGGTLLEDPVLVAPVKDWSHLADELYDSLTNPQRVVWDSTAPI
jgi:hypothetical protein